MNPLRLIALDGADEDGGTLYALYENGRPILTASIPQPLEAWARENGRTIVRDSWREDRAA